MKPIYHLSIYLPTYLTIYLLIHPRYMQALSLALSLSLSLSHTHTHTQMNILRQNIQEHSFLYLSATEKVLV